MDSAGPRSLAAGAGETVCVGVLGWRLNINWHWVKKDRQPPGDPSYLSGVGSCGSWAPGDAARSGLPPRPVHSGTVASGQPRWGWLPGRWWTVWRPGVKWSAHTASPPAVATADSPAEHPAAPACGEAGSGPLAPWWSERTVRTARWNQTQTRDIQSRSRLF